jgi:hypothetical protein
MKSATPPLRKRCFWLPKGTQIEPFWVHFGKDGFKKQASLFDMASEEHFLYFFIFLGSKWLPKRHPKRHQNAPKLTREPFGARFRENDVPAPPRQHPKAPKVFQIDPKMHPKGYPQASYTTERFQLGPHEARSTLNFGPNGPDPT